MRMSFTIIETALGYVLMAATERGVAAVRFGKTRAALKAELAREYPQAQRVRDDNRLHPWVTLLQHHLQGQPMQTAVPLDIQGSTFQWKVWKALQTITSGSTRSYREIAQAIGAQATAQEVAQACATNPVAVFIPCHRVIRSNGELGGYHWGRARKQQLLALERAAAPKAPADEAEMVTSR